VSLCLCGSGCKLRVPLLGSLRREPSLGEHDVLRRAIATLDSSGRLRARRDIEPRRLLIPASASAASSARSALVRREARPPAPTLHSQICPPI
jgi:hypothetical protein